MPRLLLTDAAPLTPTTEALPQTIVPNESERVNMIVLLLCSLAAPAPEDPSPRRPTLPYVWSTSSAGEGRPNETLYFRHAMTLTALPASAALIVTADNVATVWVNGRRLFDQGRWDSPARAQVQGLLKVGDNCLAVQATSPSGPAMLLAELRLVEPNGRVVSHWTGPHWTYSKTPTPRWNEPVAKIDRRWKPVELVLLKGADPWKLDAAWDKARRQAAIPVRDIAARRAWVRRELATLPKPLSPKDPNAAIDSFLESWWSDHQLSKPPEINDAAFLRRASLDLIGLLPSEKELDEFLKDARPDKRARRVDRLLSNDQAYAEHWITFFADLFRNDEQTNIDGLRKPITAWLLEALTQNRPYDEMACELLDPRGSGADGFLRGVNWRGAVNASQTPVIQAAQTSAQVFLGVGIKCASCHDHFTRDWTLEQSHAYASFFSPTNVEIHRCDKPMGRSAPPRFLFEGMEAGLSREGTPLDLDRMGYAERLTTVAAMVTRPKNPRFARVIVNRLFKRLIGQGLIDRVDDLDYCTAFSPPLLDWLARDFMEKDYNLKSTIRAIATSKVYGMVADDGPRIAISAEKHAEPLFRGPRLRRMQSEQLLDGVASVTGDWPTMKSMQVTVDNPLRRAWRRVDPTLLETLMGRPNREQVASERLDEATVLQSLELVNGAMLTERLQSGAKALLSDPSMSADPDSIMETLARRAYARSATASERRLAREMLAGDEGQRRAGLEDLLWIIVASPEFQFLY